MADTDFITLYRLLPTRSHQKEVRHRIFLKGNVNKNTFNQWVRREHIPSDKDEAFCLEILREYQQEIGLN